MGSWAEVGVGELDDSGYGVSTGWLAVEDGRTFIRQFETPHFMVNLTTQGRRFKQIVELVKAESPELAALFTDWGGCAFAHGESRPSPVLRKLPMIRTLATVDGAVRAAWIGAVFVSKRDSYTQELGAARMAGEA